MRQKYIITADLESTPSEVAFQTFMKGVFKLAAESKLLGFGMEITREELPERTLEERINKERDNE